MRDGTLALWTRDRPLLRREAAMPHIHPDLAAEKQVREMRPFSQLLNPRLDLGDERIGFRDLNSSGRLFEIVPIPSEAGDPEYLEKTQSRIATALCDLIPERRIDPWIVQTFVYDEPDLGDFELEIAHYAAQHGRQDQFTECWLGHLGDHLADTSAAKGLFRNEQNRASGNEKPFHSRRRRHRLCIWRRSAPGEAHNPTDNLDYVSERLETVCAQAGIRLRRLGAGELYRWLTQWFSSAANQQAAPYEHVPDKPWSPELASFDIARSALQGAAPASDEQGLWWFRGRPSRFITIDEPTRAPEIGHLTGERTIGNVQAALWDSMPPGTIWSQSVVACLQDDVIDHIKRVRHNSVGAEPETLRRTALADEALEAIAAHQPIFRVFCGVFVFAPDAASLDRKTSQVLAILSAHGLSPIAPQNDPIAQDSYIRALPFNYDPLQDSRWYARRARLWHIEHIARVLPFFGRSVGTSNPGVIAFNRGAEPLAYDPLNVFDRAKNAHALVLGPTGSGKTSWLIYQLLHLMAVRRPRLYLITALPTFGLFADFCRSNGLSVARRAIDTDGSVSLPPFAEAVRLTQTGTSADDRADDPETSSRDLLGEMEILARLMVTGGEPNEERRLRRDDRDLIRKAIIHAGRATRKGQQTMTSDVVASLRTIAESTPDDARISKALEESAARMAAAMNLFCTGADELIFNRPGQAWPDADVTVVELGHYARKGYEDRLAITITGLMSAIQNRVEAEQHSERQTIVVVDEAHVLLQNPLVSPYLARIVATWRTYGAWLWIATQNLRQFPDSAKELLDQPEWWTLLALDRDEIEQISRFRSITPEQEAMILSARKVPDRYTEGVVLSSGLMNLFRNIPPAIALALAQTEKHEKAARDQLREEFGLSELEAAQRIADRIRRERLQ